MVEPSISEHAFVGPGVVIGKNVSIGPGAVILGPCTIGDNVWIGPGALIGGPPEVTTLVQNSAWAGELAHAGVRIGDNAVIRESAVIHQGTHRETTVGAGSWVLNRAYLAHDVVLENDVVISAGVSIGGHSDVGAGSNIGMNASIHQRVRIGAGCMIGMNTPLARDIPPYTKAYGSPARLHGMNTYALNRVGASSSDAETLEGLYRHGDVQLVAINIDELSPAVRVGVQKWKQHDNLRTLSFADEDIPRQAQ